MKKVYFLLALIAAASFAFAKSNNASDKTEKKTPKVVAEPMLSGTVVDAETKRPLADVTISIKTPGKADQNITTDASGNFRMPTLTQGTYTLKFEKDNYRAGEKNNVAIKTTTVKLNIELWQEDTEEDRHGLWDKHGFFKR